MGKNKIKRAATIPKDIKDLGPKKYIIKEANKEHIKEIFAVSLGPIIIIDVIKSSNAIPYKYFFLLKSKAMVIGIIAAKIKIPLL